MVKRIIAVLAVVAGLSGCASTNKVLSKQPTAVYHSPKTVNQVAFCLANKNNTSALDQDDGSKVVLLKNGYGGVSLAFTIKPDPSGSVIEYRKEFGTVGGQWKKCVGLEPWKD